MNVNNVTRKILPIAASAAIGLGAMTSCSSSKEEKQEPTYLQTEMLKLDNTLDSLKSVRGEGDRAFFDYYVESKDVIDKANIKGCKSEKSEKHQKKAGYAALALLGCTILGLWCATKLKTKSCLACIIGAALNIFACGAHGLLAFFTAADCQDNFKQYKEQKLEQLDLEKNQYFENSKEL